MSNVSMRGYNFRKLSTRRKIFGTPERPRLAVYRSLKHIFAQVVDDTEGKTLAAAGSNTKTFPKGTGIEKATKVGELVAKKAISKGIKTVVFDRGGRLYHGQIKALADSAREAGLKF